jgi:uncharacterized membrane protein YdjX (TVP38/TMEM64 family)
MRRPAPAAYARGLALLLALGGMGWLLSTHGVPTAAEVRALVVGAGVWAPALYVAVFASLTLVAAPRNVLTTVGAALFGVAGGIGLSWLAALLGAAAGFGVGRVLGADAVERLTRGRLERVSAALRDHGIESVIAARLMPVVPFAAVNYGAGVLGVRFAHFALGTAVGIIPGTVAYAVLGAYALDDPWLVAAVGAGLLALFVVGTVVVRRLRARRHPERRCPATESADAAL